MALKKDTVQLDIIIGNDAARKELVELESQAAKVKTEMKSLKKGSEEYITASKKLEEIHTKMDAVRSSFDLAKMSMKELKKEAALLKVQLNNAIPGSEEFTKYESRLKSVNTRISELTTGSKAASVAQTSLKTKISNLADGFNKYSQLVIGLMATLTGLVLSFRKVIQVFNDFEEKVDNLSALTGLAGDELDWLSDQARTLATTVTDSGVRITQGAGDIVDAFTKVGSKRSELLAVKEDLASVTEDAIILSQAAKTELEPAVTALTTTLNQFQLSADQSSRIINSIAAGSKVGAGEIPYISEAMEKAGTTANLMGISLEEVIGAIETVAPFWEEASMAGRSFDRVLLKLKANQIGYTDGVFNLQDAISQLEKMYASGTSASDLFGTEHAKMGEILVAQKDTLAKYTEQVTGTNIAIEQAIINTNNNASALAQAKNRVEESSIVLGEKLAPALTFSTNGFNYLMKAIIAIIENWDTLKRYLITGTAAVITYTFAVEGATIAKRAYSLAVGLAEKAQKLFNSTVKSNPVGILITALTTVAVALIAFKDRIAESNKTVREFNKELQTEKTELNNVFEALKKTNPGTEERKELIAKINEEYGEYLPNQLDENANLLDIAKAQTAANNALQRNLVLKYQATAQEELFSKALETQIKYSNKLIDDLKNANLASVITSDWQEVVDKAIEADFQIKNSFTDFEPLTTFISKYKDDLNSLFPESEYLTFLDEIVEAENSKNEELLRVNSIFNSYLTEDNEEYYNQELMALKKELQNKLITEEEYWIKKAELQAKYGIDYFPEETTDVADTLEEDEDFVSDDATKTAEEKAKAEADLTRYIKELNKELLEDEKEKALAEVELWKEAELLKIDESLAAEAQKLTASETLNKVYLKKIEDIEQEYNQKKQDAISSVYDFLSEKEGILATERQKIIDAEVKSIENEYEEKIKLLKDYSGTEEEIKLLEKAKIEEVAAYKLQKEIELADQILSVREEYELITDEEHYNNEVLKLENYYNQALLTQEEYTIAKANLEAAYYEKLRQYRIDELNDLADKYQQKKEIVEAYGNVVTGMQDLEMQKAEDKYNHDLDKYGKSEASKANITAKFEREKKEIEKRYAVASLAMSSAKAVANGAVAITRALAELGPIAGPIAAVAIGAEAAIQIAAAYQQYNTVTQLRKGKYTVRGKDDGRLYNADYVQNLNTGIVHSPTLVAEEPEAVIDYKTLYNPKTDEFGMTVLDHFNSIRAIKFNQVQQLAEGKYPDAKSAKSTQNQEIDYTAHLIEIEYKIEFLIKVMMTYSEKMNNWQEKLSVDYYSFEKAQKEVEKLKTDTSIRRG